MRTPQGIFSTWPIFRLDFVMPFSARILAAVVPNFLAIVVSVSPFFTRYVVRTEGSGLPDGSIEGLMVDVGLGDLDGRAATADGWGDGCAAPPADSLVRATIAKATIISATRAT